MSKISEETVNEIGSQFWLVQRAAVQMEIAFTHSDFKSFAAAAAGLLTMTNGLLTKLEGLLKQEPTDGQETN